MIRYTADSDYRRPVPVECEKRGYPNKDATGETQYDNSHFDTEAECWNSIERSMVARVESYTHSVRDDRARLAKSEKKLVDWVLALDEMRGARKADPDAR